MELIIKGDENKIKGLEKELRLRAKRHGLKMSIKDVKAIKVKAEPVEPVITDDINIVVEETVNQVDDIIIEDIDAIDQKVVEPVIKKEDKKTSKK